MRGNQVFSLMSIHIIAYLWSGSYVTTTNHSFTSSNLISIMALGFFSSTPLNRRYLDLCYRVGNMSIYKSEGYSIRRILGMIQNDKGEQESDDKDLGG